MSFFTIPNDFLLLLSCIVKVNSHVFSIKLWSYLLEYHSCFSSLFLYFFVLLDWQTSENTNDNSHRCFAVYLNGEADCLGTKHLC